MAFVCFDYAMITAAVRNCILIAIWEAEYQTCGTRFVRGRPMDETGCQIDAIMLPLEP